MPTIEVVTLAARLLGTSATLLLLPGLVILATLQLSTAWPERIVFAFLLSYSWIFILSVLVPLFGWTSDHAGVLTLMLVAGLGLVAHTRRHARREASAARHGGRPEAWLLLALVVASAIGAWVMEPPLSGEEALDLASISRFADGGPITFDNTWLLPNARPMYLFQPYQLAVGTIARWSGLEPLVALVKLRAFIAPLCLVFLYALLRRLTATRGEAAAAFVVVLVFIAFDFRTWENNSLIPFMRRQSLASGLLAPAMMVLCLTATRRGDDANGRSIRRLALGLAPIMVVASLSTHALEVFTLLCFAAAASVVILVGIDRTGDRTHAVVLMVLLAGAAVTYTTVQARAVLYVTEYEHPRKVALLSDLRRFTDDVHGAVAGGVPEGARDLLSRATPETVAGVLGVPALMVAALRMPVAAAVLALAIVPLMLTYATPAGYTLLGWLTSDIQAQAVSPYLGLLGLLAVGLALVATAQLALGLVTRRQRGIGRVIAVSAAGSVVLWIAWIAEQQAVRWLVSLAVARLPFLLLIGGIVAISVLTLAAVREDPLLGPAPFSFGVALLTLCLALPLATAEWSFGGAFGQAPRVSVVTAFREALAFPSVLDWPSYYEYLQDAIAPRLPVPRAVVDELRRRIPPRQTLLANPSYSCALVVLVNAYCINPERIYGHAFLPAARYHAAYVHAASAGDFVAVIHHEDEPAGGRTEGDNPQHPFFNSTSSLSDLEKRFLGDYHVSYVLADPEHAEQIDRKLREAGVGATLEMSLEGYHLYRIHGA